MNRNRILAMFVVVALSGVLTAYVQGAEKTASFSVKDFGAKGDGKTLDTKAIQKALDKCAEAGGGLVKIPSGNYLSGAIFIKSNSTLCIVDGDVLTGSSEETRDYPVIDSRFAGTEQNCHASLINAHFAQIVIFYRYNFLDFFLKKPLICHYINDAMSISRLNYVYIY